MSFGNNGSAAVGVIGLGAVGEAVRDYFQGAGWPLRVFDPHQDLGSLAEINEADLIFICLPTPYQPRTGVDDSAIEAAVSRLDGSKIIVIKSTVLPGTTEAYQFRYPQHCFLVNPDFLRRAAGRGDVLRPDRQIIGYTAQSRHLAEWLLSLLPQAPYSRAMVAREAELAKYATNAFLALKVTFANELFDLCCALDIDYEAIREALAADLRIGPSHLDVFEGGYRGYSGASLPKDTKALLHLSGRLGVPLRLLLTADQVNASLLPPSETPANVRLLPISKNGDSDEPETSELAA